MKKFDPQRWVEGRKAAIQNASRLRQAREGSAASLGLSAKGAPLVAFPSDETLSQSWDWPVSRSDNLDHSATSVYVVADTTPDPLRPSNEPRIVSYEPSDISTNGVLVVRKSDEISATVRQFEDSSDLSATARQKSIPLSARAPYRHSTALSKISAADDASKKTSLYNIADRTAQILADAKAVQNPSQKSSSGELVTRQMLDKNTLRLSSRETFVSAVKLWRSGFGPRGPPVDPVPVQNAADVLVYVRKRPIFSKELSEKLEYDSVTADTRENTLTVHNCLFHADLRRPLIAHTRFSCFHGVFAENSDNQQLYMDTCARQMVKHACSGGLAALFMFGQTGSGKTYTMTALEGIAARDIFSFAGVSCSVSLSFIEICGKKAFDLLSDQADNPEVKMREMPDGSMHAVGANEVEVSDAESLKTFMHLGHTRRATKATGANFESSRSHAICSVRIKAAASSGKLMLIDCAGSERRKDSLNHDKDRRREGAEINSSLHALKECMRWRAETASNRRVTSAVPFRGSLLTRVISEAFTKLSTMLAVIATISPCATDVEHTLSTLRTVHFLSNKADSTVCLVKQTELFPKEDKPVKTPPGKWTTEMASAWVKQMSGGKADIVKGTTGQMLVRMTEARLCQICNGDEQLGRVLYKSLHDLIRDPKSNDIDLTMLANVARKRPATSSQPSTASSGKSTSIKAAAI